MTRSKRKKSSPPTPEARIQRAILATFCVIFLAAGLAIRWFHLLDSTSEEFVSGMLLKVGFVLGLGWVAAPQLERFGWQRLRGSVLVIAVIVLVLWAIRPKIGAIVGGALIAATVLFSLVGWVRSLTQFRSGR